MWLLKVNAPDKEAQQLQLKPGTLTVGRLSTNEIVIDDVAASRRHAEITLDPFTDTVKVADLGSTNGTYVDRQRLTDPVTLQSGDVIRIGQVTMYLSQQVDEARPQRSGSGTHRFTRELVLEALDQHAILLYDTARRLNTVTDRAAIVKEVTDQITKALSVDLPAGLLTGFRQPRIVRLSTRSASGGQAVIGGSRFQRPCTSRW
jgi:predicted component of type VI protein secretion system